MTIFEALYGSQYYELISKGRDGNKARINGNLLLSAFIIMVIFAIIIVLDTFSIDFQKESVKILKDIFGSSSGKTIARIIVYPLLILIYFLIHFTIGSKNKFDGYCKNFMEYSDEEKKKSTKLLLFPFLSVLAVLFVFSMLSFFR